MKPESMNGQPKTPAYRLRANKIHSKLKTMCHRWMTLNRPEIVERFRRKVKKEAERG